MCRVLLQPALELALNHGQLPAALCLLDFLASMYGFYPPLFNSAQLQRIITRVWVAPASEVEKLALNDSIRLLSTLVLCTRPDGAPPLVAPQSSPAVEGAGEAVEQPSRLPARAQMANAAPHRLSYSNVDMTQAAKLGLDPSKLSLNLRQSYELGQEIGRGAYGSVHLCTHRTTGVVYAVKRLDVKGLNNRLLRSELRRAWWKARFFSKLVALAKSVGM